MSNETPTSVEAPKSKASLVPKPEELQPVTVSREVDGKTVSLGFEPFQIKKGTSAGSWYMAPNLADKAAVLAFVGTEKVFDFVKAKLSALANGWTGEASASEDEQTGNPVGYDETKFSDFASKFAARGESIGELEALRDGYIEEMSALDADNETDGPAIIALMRQIKQVNIDMAAKKRKPKTVKTTSESPVAVAA